MNIIGLIKKRSEIGIKRIGEFDKWISEVALSDENEEFLILREGELSNFRGANSAEKIQINGKFSIKGMYDLSCPLPDTKTKTQLTLYHLSKKPNQTFSVGVFRNCSIIKRTNRSASNPFTYISEYTDYLTAIESIVNGGSAGNTFYYQFNTVSTNLLESDILIPKRYTKRVFDVIEALKNEKTVKLSEVADIIRPKPDNDRTNRQKILTFNKNKYPIDYDALHEGVNTDTPIFHHDIIFGDFSKNYLIDEEPKIELHTSPNFYVIRAKKISPYYLYLYIQSETAQIILQSLSKDNGLGRIRHNDLYNLPIILPSKTDAEYKEIFELQYKRHSNFTSFTRKSINVLNNYVPTKKKTIENIITDEWIQNIHICKTSVMKEFLDDDFNELNICFKHKAYKATLILAGSILEAVLIDWLSEIKGKNFFETDYKVKREKKDKNGNTIKNKDGHIVYYDDYAQLNDYINEIKKLAKPSWMKSKEAHEIRNKRNLVHAKLCMKETEQINEKTCRKVIQYLIEVIETRGICIK